MELIAQRGRSLHRPTGGLRLLAAWMRESTSSGISGSMGRLRVLGRLPLQLLLLRSPVVADPGVGESGHLQEFFGYVLELINCHVGRFGHFQLERPRPVLSWGRSGFVELADMVILRLEPLMLVMQALHDAVQLNGGLEELVLRHRDGHGSRRLRVVSPRRGRSLGLGKPR